VSKKNSTKTKSRYDRYRRARAALRRVMQQARHKTVDLDGTSVEIGVFDTDDHRLIGTVIITLRDLSLLANHSCEIDAMTRAVQRIGARVLNDPEWTPTPGAPLRQSMEELAAVIRMQSLDDQRAAEDRICRKVAERLGVQPVGWAGILATRDDLIGALSKDRTLREVQVAEKIERTTEQNTLGAVLHGLGLPTEQLGPDLTAADVVKRIEDTYRRKTGYRAVEFEHGPVNITGGHNPFIGAVSVGGRQGGKNTIADGARAGIADLLSRVGIPAHSDDPTLSAAKGAQLVNEKIEKQVANQAPIVDFHQARVAAARLDGAVTVARDILPAMPKTVDEIAVAVRRKLHQAALQVAHNIAVELYGDDGQHVKDGGDLIALVRRRRPSGEPLNRAADMVEVAERRRLLTTVNYGNPVDEMWPRSPSRTVAALRQIIRHQTLQQLHNQLFGPIGEDGDESLPTDITVAKYAEHLPELMKQSAAMAAVVEHIGSTSVRERYDQLRRLYTAEHDRTHHTMGDFTDSVIALLMSGRDRLHVDMGRWHNSSVELRGVHGRRELWKLGPTGPSGRHIIYSDNDRERLVEAAALLMCAAEAFTP